MHTLARDEAFQGAWALPELRAGKRESGKAVVGQFEIAGITDPPAPPRKSLWIRARGRVSLWAMARSTPLDFPRGFSRPLPIIGV